MSSRLASLLQREAEAEEDENNQKAKQGQNQKDKGKEKEKGAAGANKQANESAEKNAARMKTETERLSDLIHSTRVDLFPMHISPPFSTNKLNRVSLSSVSSSAASSAPQPKRRTQQKKQNAGMSSLATTGTFAFDAELAPSKAIIFDLALTSAPLPAAATKKKGFF